MRRHVHFALPLLMAAWASGACLTAGEMHPGKACGSCHSGDHAPSFGAAGTVYASPVAAARDGIEGVTIDIVDADNRRVSLESNGLGNFFTSARLEPPLQVAISKGSARMQMADAPSGDCNSCHAAGTQGPGRVYLR